MVFCVQVYGCIIVESYCNDSQIGFSIARIERGYVLSLTTIRIGNPHHLSRSMIMLLFVIVMSITLASPFLRVAAIFRLVWPTASNAEIRVMWAGWYWVTVALSLNGWSSQFSNIEKLPSVCTASVARSKWRAWEPHTRLRRERTSTVTVVSVAKFWYEILYALTYVFVIVTSRRRQILWGSIPVNWVIDTTVPVPVWFGCG